jgi:hypothetical protein
VVFEGIPEEKGTKCHVRTLIVPSTFHTYGEEPMKAEGSVNVECFGRRQPQEEKKDS